MRRTRYSEQTMADVCAALLAGSSVTQAAETFGVPRSTVANWSSKLRRGVPFKRTQKRDGAVARYVVESLRAATRQTDTFADPAWLRQQDARSLAKLHGTLADRLLRIAALFG